MSTETANIVMPWLILGAIPSLGLSFWIEECTSFRMTRRQAATLIVAAWLLAPLVLVGEIAIGLFVGSRALCGGAVEWWRAFFPARSTKVVKPVADPFLESARREVNEIAPEEP